MDTMLKNTLIATATAGLLALGSLVATTGGAAAAGPQNNGPNFTVQIGGGFGPGPGWHGGPPRACKPIVKNVKYYTYWGKPYWKQVVVGQDCGPRRGPHHGPRGPHHGGPFPGGPFPGGPHGGPGWGW